jgi:hypothetical protein
MQHWSRPIHNVSSVMSSTNIMVRNASISFTHLSHLPHPGRISTWSTAAYLTARRIHTSKPRNEFHFDTHHFVQRLEREGLNRAQAEGIMSAMAEVIDESIRNMTSNMVTKADQEKVS